MILFYSKFHNLSSRSLKRYKGPKLKENRVTVRPIQSYQDSLSKGSLVFSKGSLTITAGSFTVLCRSKVGFYNSSLVFILNVKINLTEHDY